MTYILDHVHGTNVSQYADIMFMWFLNLHPWELKPERWVEAAQKGFPLADYLGIFSRRMRDFVVQN